MKSASIRHCITIWLDAGFLQLGRRGLVIELLKSELLQYSKPVGGIIPLTKDPPALQPSPPAQDQLASEDAPHVPSTTGDQQLAGLEHILSNTKEKLQGDDALSAKPASTQVLTSGPELRSTTASTSASDLPQGAADAVRSGRSGTTKRTLSGRHAADPLELRWVGCCLG